MEEQRIEVEEGEGIGNRKNHMKMRKFILTADTTKILFMYFAF